MQEQIVPGIASWCLGGICMHRILFCPLTSQLIEILHLQFLLKSCFIPLESPNLQVILQAESKWSPGKLGLHARQEPNQQTNWHPSQQLHIQSQPNKVLHSDCVAPAVVSHGLITPLRDELCKKKNDVRMDSK